MKNIKKTTFFIVACILANVAFGQIRQPIKVEDAAKENRARALAVGTGIGNGVGAFEQAQLTGYSSIQGTVQQTTTQEEYNYITKGYKIQIESGLDMKKGYTLVDMGKTMTTTWGKNRELRECSFKGLIRDGQTKPCAIMMIYKRTDIPNGAVYYICIPTYYTPQEIWQQTYDFIEKTFNDVSSIPMMQTVIRALMHFGSQEANN